MVSVYATPGMGLLDKKSIKIEKVSDFQWSPADNIFAFWTPEVGNTPARVALMEVPSKQEIRQKPMFNVQDIRLMWQKQGHYLSCKVDRTNKGKKGSYPSNFEIFCPHAKDIPVEVLDLVAKETKAEGTKETVVAFAWEPKGHRFAIVHGEAPGKYDVSFYSMEKKPGTQGPQLLHKLENKACTSLYWSPAGNNIVLAGLGSTLNGSLEFYNVNDAETYSVQEHFSCTDLEWDPSGRFLCSWASYFRNKIENGYMIWTFYGKELAAGPVDQLFQFLWRPRPASYLSPEEETAVLRSFKEYRDRFEREDAELREAQKSGKAARRKQLRDEWKQYLETCRKRVEEEAELRASVRPEPETDEEYEVIEETVEEIVELKEEVDKSRKMITSDDERD